MHGILANSDSKQRSFDVSKVHFNYQGGPTESKKTKQRQRVKQRELKEAAASCKPLSFESAPASSHQSEEADIPLLAAAIIHLEDLKTSIERLSKKLKAKKEAVSGQNLMRHQCVLAFMNLQLTKPVEELRARSRNEKESRRLTREEMAILVAKAYGRGRYLGRCIVQWERQWRSGQAIEEGRRGCYGKSHSWFNDEGVRLHIRE